MAYQLLHQGALQLPALEEMKQLSLILFKILMAVIKLLTLSVTRLIMIVLRKMYLRLILLLMKVEVEALGALKHFLLQVD